MISSHTPMEIVSNLPVPDSLRPRTDRILPTITPETIKELGEKGWSRIGIMSAFVDSNGQIMMLGHHGRDKNKEGVLGPLGETAQRSGPIIEQPMQTLFRGIQEELGIQHPTNLDFFVYKAGGWVINQWPRGDNFPGEFSCAISFPVFVPDSVKAYLTAIPHGTEEVQNMYFMSPEEILNIPDRALRPGVKPWLSQLYSAGLLNPAEFGQLVQVDFSDIYEASLEDLRINQ